MIAAFGPVGGVRPSIAALSAEDGPGGGGRRIGLTGEHGGVGKEGSVPGGVDLMLGPVGGSTVPVLRFITDVCRHIAGCTLVPGHFDTAGVGMEAVGRDELYSRLSRQRAHPP